MQVAIEPKTKADLDKMGMGLYKLAQEDPSFHFQRDEETNQTVIEVSAVPPLFLIEICCPLTFTLYLKVFQDLNKIIGGTRSMYTEVLVIPPFCIHVRVVKQVCTRHQGMRSVG